MADANPVLRLKPGRDKSLRQRHPWIFSGAIGAVDGPLERGETVYIHTDDGALIARAAFTTESQIRERVWAETEKELGRPLLRVSSDAFQPRRPDDRHAHIGVHPQRQPGLNYVGIVLPVGRMQAEQLRELADIADSCGNGDIRLTPWQNST